jgi:hypothetical protein
MTFREIKETLDRTAATLRSYETVSDKQFLKAHGITKCKAIQNVASFLEKVGTSLGEKAPVLNPVSDR